MEKQAKVSPAVTLEAVTVPLADGRRGVVLVLTDEYSRKNSHAGHACQQVTRRRTPTPGRRRGSFFYSAAVASAASAGSSNAGGVVPPVCSGVPLVLLKTSLDSLEKTSFAYST